VSKGKTQIESDKGKSKKQKEIRKEKNRQSYIKWKGGLDWLCFD
jgi:hypothetical protein